MNKYCPQCGTVLLSGKCPDCKTGETTGNNYGPYPTLNDFKIQLEKLLENSKADFTVDFFLKLIQPPQPEEAPKVVNSKGTDRWIWPYETRVIVLFKTYMSCDTEFQKFIIAAREDDIYWRGDDPDFFYLVVKEHERMKVMGVEKYQQEALNKLEQVTDKLSATGTEG